MRICRFRHEGKQQVGFYFDSYVVPIEAAQQLHTDATHEKTTLEASTDLLDYLPPVGKNHRSAAQLAEFLDRYDQGLPPSARILQDQLELLVPIPRPNKLFLLAGNYAQHIEEGGGVAAEREETFPYVFMKPPTTTLTHPGRPVTIPAISPDTIDWEIELAVIIGQEAKGISQSDALSVVAGYTVINDISNRQFRPNPKRKERPKDTFFDWLHGKWFDSFCPCGPCVTSAATIPDPQQLSLKLSVNGQVRQDSSTANQIFPVAAVIQFISSFVTLEPGDIISTGTPAGVGSTTKTFLKPGDQVVAEISSIGTLKSPIVAEA